MLEFDPQFFEPETREGFYIEPMIKNVWAAQLETLNLLDIICDEHNLTYSADWGTLLGAIRHGGYIPWDDDFDVCMPRADLMKLFDIIDNYPELVCVNVYNTPDMGLHATRLNLSTDFTVDRDRLKDLCGCPFPVGIDIFSVGFVPKDESLLQEMTEALTKINYAIDMLSCMEQYQGTNKGLYKEYRKRYREYVSEIKGLTHIEFADTDPSLQELSILYDEVQGAYGEADANAVFEVPGLMTGLSFPIDTYEHMIRVPFENTTIPVPANYNEVLNIKYGASYMRPLNTGGNHNYPYYDASIKQTMTKNASDSFENTKEHIKKLSSDYYRHFINRESEPRIAFNEPSSDTAKIQAALLEVLAEVERLCEENDITFYYVGDTCGEIDNIRALSGESTDVHIAMKRPDYMRFLKVLQEELDPWFDYRSIYSHAEHLDMKTYVITDAYATGDGEYEKRFHGCRDIVGIDIAPIDLVSADEKVEALKKTVIAQLLQTAPALPTERPYSDDIIGVAKQWDDMFHLGINTDGNLQSEFMKAADSVAMSDANSNSGRCRISPDITTDDYKIYEESEFNE